ncbi:MAG TPA: peptide chain release factor N(5)-glutamine methyltransferase [bacterium]|nr:peptide chain release factor N(5)-glutamine methyltransferase [bacterium]
MTDVADNTRTWRVLELVNWTTNYLREKGFSSPRSDVEWLLCSVCQCSRVDLYTDFEKPLTRQELSEFKSLLTQRLKHKPVQYIIGETEFMGMPFRVNEHVLIPRPETELLVEHAVDWLRQRTEDRLTVLDIGTGSGCIAVSIGALVPKATVTAIDVSGEALKVAEENAHRNKVEERVHFLRKNILEEAPTDGPYHLIVSNPPYVGEEEFSTLDKAIRDYEPAEALVAENGLLFFRRFAASAKQWLESQGLLLVEIGGTHQVPAVTELFENAGWKDITIARDYNNQGRILQAHPYPQ